MNQDVMISWIFWHATPATADWFRGRAMVSEMEQEKQAELKSSRWLLWKLLMPIATGFVYCSLWIFCVACGFEGESFGEGSFPNFLSSAANAS